MVVQFVTMIVAIGLIKKTRYNISWMLIAVGLVLMVGRRLFDLSSILNETHWGKGAVVNSWMGVFISVLFLIGILFIRKIFHLQIKLDQLREENEVRILSSVIRAEEKARQTFARELHDGLGPVLSSLKMTMTAVDADALSPVNQKIIQRSCMVADEAVTSLKEIAENLSPHLLGNYGLKMAVTSFAQQIVEGNGVHTEIRWKATTVRYAYFVEINLYRIICELMNNSVQHGSPKKIWLAFFEEEKLLRILYRDDGCGFNRASFPKANDHSNTGMDHIQSRVKSLSGDCLYRSEPGKGFKIEMTIPKK